MTIVWAIVFGLFLVGALVLLSGAIKPNDDLYIAGLIMLIISVIIAGAVGLLTGDGNKLSNKRTATASEADGLKAVHYVFDVPDGEKEWTEDFNLSTDDGTVIHFYIVHMNKKYEPVNKKVEE